MATSKQVQDVGQSPGPRRRDPVHREGRVLLPGDDHAPPALQSPEPQEGAGHWRRGWWGGEGGGEARVRGEGGAVRHRQGV